MSSEDFIEIRLRLPDPRPVTPESLCIAVMNRCRDIEDLEAYPLCPSCGKERGDTLLRLRADHEPVFCEDEFHGEDV